MDSQALDTMVFSLIHKPRTVVARQSVTKRRRMPPGRAVFPIVISALVVTGARAGDLLEPSAGLDAPVLSREVRLSFDPWPAAALDPAQDAAAPVPDGGTPVDSFSKGSRFVTVYGSAIFGDPGKGEMYLVHGGVGSFFEDYQSVSLDLFGGYVRSGIDDNGGAIGLDVVYRNHFVRSDDERQTVFFNAGLGLQQASTNFSGRRHFNLRTRIGFGATFKLDDQVRAFIGADYQHISDAGIEGGGGGFDGPMIYAGVTFPF